MSLWKYFFRCDEHPWWASLAAQMVKNPPAVGSVPRLGRSPAERKGYSLQYSGRENSMDRGVWQATVHTVSKSQTQLSDFHFHFQHLNWASLVAQFSSVQSLSHVRLFVTSWTAARQAYSNSCPLSEWWWDTLREEMATLSSIPAWRLPWLEKPSGLQSMGLQKNQKRQLNNNKLNQ